MDPAQLDFNITISIQSANSSVTQTLYMNPATPFVVNTAGTVAAQLLGDLMSYKSMPDFSSYYLMIPSPSGEALNPSLQGINPSLFWQVAQAARAELMTRLCFLMI